MSLLQLRQRLKTIKGLNSIFSALEVVTVVRTRKVREPYKLIDSYLQPMREVLTGRIKNEKLAQKVLVVVTSNRGLCGAFNNLAVSKAREFMAENPEAKLVLIGKFGSLRLGKFSGRVLFQDLELAEKMSFEKVKGFCRRLFELHAEIYVAHNTYKSAMQQVPNIYRLYPVPEELESKKNPAEFLLEPEPSLVIDEMFRHYLETRFFRLLLDSQMGELSARLLVLKGAIDTSKDITDDLFIQINKARQASITKDLLEIVSAAEALRSEYE